MNSQNLSRSTPDLYKVPRPKGKKFQQDYQAEENPEVLKQFLIDSQLKESQNKQKLYQTKRENEGLKEQLDELEAQKKKLEFAKDINQKFFKKNENEMISMRKPLEDQHFFTDNFMTSDSQEALRKKIRETQIEYHQEVDNQFEKLPDFERIFQSSDQDLGKITQGQSRIFSSSI